MKKNVTIVTEGKTDADFLTKLLGEKQFNADYKVLAATGQLAPARTLCRSVVDRGRVLEMREIVQQALAQLGKLGERA